MKFYRLALIFLATVTFASANAQSFEALGRPFNDWNWEIMIRRTQVTAKHTFNYGGTTFSMKFRFDDYEKGANRWHFENPTLGDMIWYVGRLINKKGMANKNHPEAEQSFGSGFFGWHHITWNAVAKDRLLVSPGISLGDYIFASKRRADAPMVNGNANSTFDPAGYYFHAGPALRVSTMIGDGMWADVYTRYDLTTRAGKPSAFYGGTPEGGTYKHPHFFGLGATINDSSTHLCLTVNYTALIDRSTNDDKASRVDISLGFMF